MSPENTKRLILKTGDIAYPDGAIAQIIQLTHGQPYLVQLIGYTLIRTFNRGDSTITLSANNHPVFNTDDLNQLVHSPEFYTIGNAYFQGVWLQALPGEPPGHHFEAASVTSNVPGTAGALYAPNPASRRESPTEITKS